MDFTSFNPNILSIFLIRRQTVENYGCLKTAYNDTLHLILLLYAKASTSKQSKVNAAVWFGLDPVSALKWRWRHGFVLQLHMKTWYDFNEHTLIITIIITTAWTIWCLIGCECEHNYEIYGSYEINGPNTVFTLHAVLISK